MARSRKLLKRRNPVRRTMRVKRVKRNGGLHMNLHTKFKTKKIPKITTHIASTLPY